MDTNENQPDPEVLAMSAVSRALLTLDNAARARVLKWAMARHVNEHELNVLKLRAQSREDLAAPRVIS